MRYERKYIQYNDLVFDGYGMLGEYDASSVSFKVTTHARSFGHGSYAPFKSPNAFVEESSVSLTLWLKEKKLPCDVRPFYRSFVIEQLSKHGKLWAVQDNTLVWAYATVQSYSEMVEHANGKLGIDVDFLLYEGVWHKADKQKTFLHPYDLCTFMDCFDYKEYQPCRDADIMACGSCGEIDVPAQSGSGSLVTLEIEDRHDAIGALSADIDPVQSLNGYDNPWAGGAGKNKLNASGGSGTVSGVTFTNTNGVIVASGSATANIYRNVGTFTPENGVEYILTGCPSGGAGGKYRITLAGYGYDLGSGYTFTGDGQSHNITCDVYTGYPTTGTTLTFKPMIRRSSESDATWQPYENICPITGFDSANIYVSPTTSVGDATTYTVSFGSAGTVYGGTLDVVSGQLTVTHGIKLVNELSWTYADTPSRCSAHITDIKRASGARRTTLLSSEYVCVDDGRPLADVPNGSIYNTGTSDWVTIVDARYTTADAFTTAQGSQQIVYPLATPLTYQILPADVNLILGTNNIWANTGDIDVETTGYHRDLYDGCFTEIPKPENNRYCCECNCDEVTQDMALCYHLDDLQDVYKECSNAGFRVIYDCGTAERFFNILGQKMCTDNCSNGTLAGKIYSETDIPTTGISITLVGKMHNPYVEINGNGNWIAGDYDGRLRIEPNGEVYYENGCRCDDPLEPDVWQVPPGMNYGWTALPRYNRVVVNLGACCGKACAYFNIDNLTI